MRGGMGGTHVPAPWDCTQAILEAFAQALPLPATPRTRQIQGESEMVLKEKALEHFHNKFTCAQALLMAYGPQCGLSEEMAGDIGKAFVGGMGFMGGTCGVATAAFMILGLHYDLQTTNDHTNLFVENFTEINKTLLCNDLLGCDISTEEGRNCMKDRNLRETLCAKLLADGCDILDAILSQKTRQAV